MVNIIRRLLIITRISGGGIIINKCKHPNFIFLLTLLTLWLLKYTIVVNKCKGVLELLNVALAVVVYITFKTKSLLLFYIFFEMSILPITMILFLYGYQPEKLQASLFLLIYTVVGRLPLLLFIVKCHNCFISSVVITVPITLGFLVKTPMFLLHAWLPKAHVEAPVGGSMVLAGVLLKLGSYGLLLFLPYIKLNPLIRLYLGLNLIGSIVGALLCLRQGDLKVLIAYSSVVHIGVVTLGLLSGSEIGYSCALIMILAHGLGSPFIFAFAYWLYSSSHSRLLLNNSSYWPIVAGLFIGLVSLNIGVPPSLGLWAEVLITIRALNLMRNFLPVLLVVFFLGTVYNLYFFTSCIHSKFSTNHFSFVISYQYPVYQVLYLTYCSCFCIDFFHLFKNAYH